MIVLYILLFIVCLSVLIMIHEAGHLAMAKLFYVYCFDYSIGFGPALFHKKRKNGETYFSIRAIPFGGYVSMFGEQKVEDLPEEFRNIPIERSLYHIAKWKRALVLLAGVFMNAVLALILFFVSALLPQQRLYVHYVEVAPNSIAETLGVDSNQFFSVLPSYERTSDKVTEKNYTSYVVYDPVTHSFETPTSYDESMNYYSQNSNYYTIDNNAFVTYNDDTTEDVSMMISLESLTFKKHSYDDCVVYFTFLESGGINYNGQISPDSNVKSVTFNLKGYNIVEVDGENQLDETPTTYTFTLNNIDGKFESSGLSMALITHQDNFGKVMQNTFTNFGEGSLAIFKAVGNLFIGKGWKDVGGVISIYTQTTTILTSYNASYFIQVWGLISVNLAILNLLPFPGLDGWQVLVLVVEAVAHKSIPEKVKNIVSYVGLAILFAFMVLIIIKDVIGLF